MPGPIGFVSSTSATLAEDVGSTESHKILQAAEQFEALLIGQLLKGVRESGSGWFGTGDDSAAEQAMGFAEGQFAQMLAAQGGLGLARLIADQLTRTAPSSTKK
jgi:peptidoglycan hydrolase FlgJ